MTEAENVKHLCFCVPNMMIWQSYLGTNIVDFWEIKPLPRLLSDITGILICGGHVVLTPSPTLPCECLGEGEAKSRQWTHPLSLWPFPLTRAPEKCRHITRCLHTLDLSLPARANEGLDRPSLGAQVLLCGAWLAQHPHVMSLPRVHACEHPQVCDILP